MVPKTVCKPDHVAVEGNRSAFRYAGGRPEARTGAFCLVFKAADATSIGFGQRLANHQPQAHAVFLGRVKG